MPSDITRFCLLLRVDRHFHAVVEHGVGLCIVEDVELDWNASPGVLRLKVEPLGVTERICIILHEQVVLLLPQFHCHE